MHGIGDRAFFPTFGMPPEIEPVVREIIDKQFGAGHAQLRSMSTGRWDASDKYYQTQLREKPNDPNTHSNFGVHLHEQKKDLEGAEREYRKTLELDNKHVNALGNLANLLWEKGNHEEANTCYLNALEIDPGNENVAWNYARFLRQTSDNREGIRKVLDRGLLSNPDSGRLLLLRGDLNLVAGRAKEALNDFRQAREKGASFADVEQGYAVALQLTGAPLGDCIRAYLVAIGLNPASGALRLNLAQLFFIKGDDAHAYKHLNFAMSLPLDDSAKLEAQFYLLAYRSADAVVVLKNVRTLLENGARLQWDVRPNIEEIKRRDVERAQILESVWEILRSGENEARLEQLLSQLTSSETSQP